MKHCPFCSSAGAAHLSSGRFTCNQCGAEGPCVAWANRKDIPSKEMRELAAKLWDTRLSPGEDATEIFRLTEVPSYPRNPNETE